MRRFSGSFRAKGPNFGCRNGIVTRGRVAQDAVVIAAVVDVAVERANTTLRLSAGLSIVVDWDYKILMPTAFDRLTDVLNALEIESVSYVLFGGQAINLHGMPRFTEDIDLFVAPSEDNVDRLRRALKRVWDDPEIDQIRAEDLAGDYAVVRYGTPDGFAIDIVGRIGEAFSFGDVESERLEVGDARARVATPRMLYRMKKDTVRPIDRADAANLRDKFGLDDQD